MRASVNTIYGPPEVLEVIDIPKPTPKDNEVLIKVHATTVNRTDTGFRAPEYFLVRLFGGLFKPKNKVLGSEFAGVIEQIGANVTQYKVGESVFGLSTYKFGAHAEYICLKEKGSFTQKPTNYSFEEAAAVCDGLMLGINIIRTIDFTKQKKILINGASGSIGTACVQLAKYYGAEVTAVCNTKNSAVVSSLGPKKIIDYSKEDFTKCGQLFDVVIDAVGKSSFNKCKEILEPNGFYCSTELGENMENVYLPFITKFKGGKQVKFPFPTDNKQDIIYFKKIIEDGKYRAIIDRKYSLEQIIEATKYVETGEKVGNVVITI